MQERATLACTLSVQKPVAGFVDLAAVRRRLSIPALFPFTVFIHAFALALVHARLGFSGDGRG
eukprot:3864490-Lingulodinium_polyedra.AAC.1